MPRPKTTLHIFFLWDNPPPSSWFILPSQEGIPSFSCVPRPIITLSSSTLFYSYFLTLAIGSGTFFWPFASSHHTHEVPTFEQLPPHHLMILPPIFREYVTWLSLEKLAPSWCSNLLLSPSSPSHDVPKPPSHPYNNHHHSSLLTSAFHVACI